MQTRPTRLAGLLLGLSLVALAPGRARADEGMWTLNAFPRELVKKRYRFDVTDRWLEHVRLSSVRFNSGGSGSWVSSTGLVMTNHHVGADCIAKLGVKDRDYIKDGFFARTAAEEIKCPDLELNVLTGIEDVTADVKAVEKPGMDDAAVNQAQKERMAAIEQRCAQATGERCDVVTLYQGGAFNLYKYKKYTDVRLVFAPEFQIAFFGGDPDNFMFPRYDLDVAFFRVYAADSAVRPEHFLKWQTRGAREGELVFTSGNPGNTERLDTVAMVEVLRDVVYPTRIRWLKDVQARLKEFGKRSPEAERQARTPLFAIENGLKAIGGYLDGINASYDPAAKRPFANFMEEKRANEIALIRKALAGKDGKKYEHVWSDIARAQETWAGLYKRYMLLEGSSRSAVSQFNAMGSMLFGAARSVLRMAEEKELPSEKRLREFRDSNLPSVELSLYTTAPIYDELEETMLAHSLSRLQAELGKNDPVVRQALEGKTPEDRARELVRGCTLKDIAVRRKLAASRAAIDAGRDPMLKLARELDAEARAVRKRYEDEVESVVKKNLALLGRAKFEVEGPGSYPDATFTLRLSFGKVAGYLENGKKIPAMTDIAGLYARRDQASGRPPWDLPPRWLAARGKLDGKTPMNFVSTNDIIGGNSGSPVVNRAGEVVGLIFDGNIQSLAGNFYFDESVNRAVSVHPGAIVAALRNVYDAGALADELEGPRPTAGAKKR